MLLPLLTAGLSPQQCGGFNLTSGAFVRVLPECAATVGLQYAAPSFLPAQYW